MKHKKFMDIERLKPDFYDGFSVGDEIYIEEKIDGANVAIRYDIEKDEIICQSRKQILNADNTLRGFYNWVMQNVDSNQVKTILGSNKILFGEWLVPHSVEYPTERYNCVYFFDCYDTSTEKYLSQNEVIDIVNSLGLTYVPIFYHGEFKSWDHCREFVGKTKLGGEYGEGIVIKNQTRLNDNDCRLPFCTKIVSESFSETKGRKKNKIIDPQELKQNEEQIAIVSTIVTHARVEKMLNKFVDEGILPIHWSSKEMSLVAKNLPKAIYDDCVKEEPEVVEQVEKFGKLAGGLCMRIAREILNKNE